MEVEFCPLKQKLLNNYSTLDTVNAFLLVLIKECHFLVDAILLIASVTSLN